MTTSPAHSPQSLHQDSIIAQAGIHTPSRVETIQSQGVSTETPTLIRTDMEGGMIDSTTVQLISQTAHDLRSPLTTVRESVRLVRDGEAGPVTPSQSEFLSAAIDQCQCIEQMVEEMVQTQRLNSGFPRARRRWVSVRDIQASVCDTLKPWTLPRNVHVLWDGPADPSVKVFGDITLLRRLVVNLVTNAIQATGEGDPVLVRLESVRDGNAIRWSVVDQGSGISARDMEAIANDSAPSKSSSGLGLMISRQLAALHFSSLWIESRINTGTVISFETPTGGPSSVASAWMRWRLSHQDGEAMRERGVVKTFVKKRLAGGMITPPRRVRFDVPTVLVELNTSAPTMSEGDRLIAGSVSLGETTSLEAADRFDGELQRHVGANEIAYRVGKYRWTWVMDGSGNLQEINRRLADLENQARADISDLRMHWGKAIDFGPLDEAMIPKLSDFMVRHSLDASKRHFSDANQVRLGTTPIGMSMVAMNRLSRDAYWIRQRAEMQDEDLRVSDYDIDTRR